MPTTGRSGGTPAGPSTPTRSCALARSSTSASTVRALSTRCPPDGGDQPDLALRPPSRLPRARPYEVEGSGGDLHRRVRGGPRDAAVAAPDVRRRSQEHH